jgi:hypothetical protein
MKNLFRSLSALTLTICLLVTTACNSGPLSRFENSLDYAPAFFTGLVIAGAIPQNVADRLNTSVNQGRSALNKRKAELAAIPSNLSANEKKLAEFRVYLALSNDWRVIVARDFSQISNPKIAQFASLITEILDIIVRQNTPPTMGGPRGASNVNLDKKLGVKLDQFDKLVKNK